MEAIEKYVISKIVFHRGRLLNSMMKKKESFASRAKILIHYSLHPLRAANNYGITQQQHRYNYTIVLISPHRKYKICGDNNGSSECNTYSHFRSNGFLCHNNIKFSKRNYRFSICKNRFLSLYK